MLKQAERNERTSSLMPGFCCADGDRHAALRGGRDHDLPCTFPDRHSLHVDGANRLYQPDTIPTSDHSPFRPRRPFDGGWRHGRAVDFGRHQPRRRLSRFPRSRYLFRLHAVRSTFRFWPSHNRSHRIGNDPGDEKRRLRRTLRGSDRGICWCTRQSHPALKSHDYLWSGLGNVDPTSVSGRHHSWNHRHRIFDGDNVYHRRPPGLWRPGRALFLGAISKSCLGR